MSDLQSITTACSNISLVLAKFLSDESASLITMYKYRLTTNFCSKKLGLKFCGAMYR